MGSRNQISSRLMIMIKAFCKILRVRAYGGVALAALLLGVTQPGCIPLTHKSWEGKYDGLEKRIKTVSAGHATVHVLMVHGMQDHCPGEWDDFLKNFAHQLHLEYQGDIVTNFLVSSLPNVTNLLRTLHYRSGDTNFLFYELTWTPTTFPYKSNAFAKDRTLKSDRLSINEALKYDLMDEGFGDAALYLNPVFRPKMQEPILQSIQVIASNIDNDDDQIIFLGHSLGSMMTFDTIAANANDPAVSKFAEKTTDIIMLANQIPLLSLGLSTNILAGPSKAAQDSPLKAFLRISNKRKHNHLDKKRAQGAVSDETATNLLAINLVAATDPNDLLSWPLGTNDITFVPDDASVETVHVNLSNIYSHNAWGVPFLFEYPVSAHNDYQKNQWLVKKLIKGFSSATSGFPSSVPDTFSCVCNKASP
jgi:hypothetical protein